jgi:hypothetical protein
VIRDEKENPAMPKRAQAVTVPRIDLIAGLPDETRPGTLADAQVDEYMALRGAAIDGLLGVVTEVTTAGVPTATIGPPGRRAHPAVWFPPPRSARTGHRIPVGDRQPIASRRLPWWTWFFEHLDRLHARLMRGQPERVRTGLEDR